MYILGRDLTVVTDNKALTFINKCQLGNSRVTRWILAIQEYGFNIVHCKGKENVVADILSRYPEDLNETQHIIPQYEELEVNMINLSVAVKKDLNQIGRR